MAWRKPELRDIAAKLSQRELDAFRKSPDFVSAADPVADLLEMTAETVRGFCRTNKQVKMCPASATIPEGLMTFAMDYAAFDVLKRISLDPNEARKAAWEKALEIFQAVAEGKFIPESYDDESEDDTQSNKAMPGFGVQRHKILETFYL